MLALLTALTLACPQGTPVSGAEASGLESLLDRLAARTAERRQKAEAHWLEQKELYLKAPDQYDLEGFGALAPEIQGPVLEDLVAQLDSQPGSALLPYVGLLSEIMNPTGAEHLALHLPALPLSVRLPALTAVASRGGPKAWRLVEPFFHQGPMQQRLHSMEVLAIYGPVKRCQSWLQALPADQWDERSLSRVLQRLGQRSLPEDFRLPESVRQNPSPTVLTGLLSVWQQIPDPESEAFLSGAVTTLHLQTKTRQQALSVLEKSALSFRWRNAERQLADHLRNHASDPMAETIAWTLHRLDHKDGAKFLLRIPEAEVKARPRDYRARMKLGRLLVDLDRHHDAYKEYQVAIKQVEVNEYARRRVGSDDWLYAARAAAGARRLKDAAEWLESSHLSTAELRQYINLPEFQALLNKQPFKRMFGEG